MTQEDKDLLLRDLCARLPYGGMMYNTLTKQDIPIQYFACMTDCKPYLRPLSSMTEEERKEYCQLADSRAFNIFVNPRYELIDWLNKHHFDYRGLIEKGLALEAPKDMYE